MLTWITFLPLLAAIVVAFAPLGRRGLEALTLLSTAVVGALALVLWTSFDGGSAVLQETVKFHWFRLPLGGASTDVSFHLGVDGISILMVVLTGLLMPIVVLSARGHIQERAREFFCWLLVMQTGMLGVFLSMDLILFYVFWEVSLVPLYFLIGIWGGEQRLYATLKFFLFTVAGSFVMLIGIIALVYLAGTTDLPTLLDRTALLTTSEASWIFGAFALAFAIKVPVLPFHTWLADAHTEAPTSGSVLLAGVLLKMGTYGLLRFGIQLFPGAAIEHSSIFMALGALGIVYGAFLAMAQTDLKRLVACSSISHLGFVVLGLFALTSAGLRGGVLQMVNHGLSTGLLFLLVGMIYERRHSRQLADYGGIAATMPIFAIFFVFTVLSSAGMPGLNGFIGEYMVLAGTFEASPFWAAIGVTGVILGAVYLLMATRRLLFGPVVHDVNRNLGDLKAREIGMLVPLVVLCIWIGVQPNLFLDKTAGSLDALDARIESARTN
ncbi:MAG: NADH-quinone oxidoreductase subunit M [Planctomycetota bacterium]